MCYGTEALYIGAALAAAGAATNSYATSQQLKKQDSIAAAGIIKQGEFQKQGNADVASTTKSLAQSNADAQAKTNQQLAAYHAALQQSSGINQSASPNVPGSSKAYKDAQTTAGASASDYVNKIASSAATTQGTQLERVSENEKMGDTAGKLGMLQNSSNEQNYLTKLQVQSVKANPWLQGLGTLMSAAGVAFGGAAGMGGSAAGAAGTAGAAAEGAGLVGTGSAGIGAGALAGAGFGAGAGAGLGAAGAAAGSFGAGAVGAMGAGAGALGSVFSSAARNKQWDDNAP